MRRSYAWIVSGAIIIMLALVAAGVTVAIATSNRDLHAAEHSWCPFVDILAAVPVKPGTPDYRLHESLITVKEYYQC